MYTDDVDKLREMVKQDQQKESVLEFTMPHEHENRKQDIPVNKPPAPEISPVVKVMLKSMQEIYSQFKSYFPFKKQRIMDPAKPKQSVEMDI